MLDRNIIRFATVCLIGAGICYAMAAREANSRATPPAPFLAALTAVASQPVIELRSADGSVQMCAWSHFTFADSSFVIYDLVCPFDRVFRNGFEVH